MMARRYEEGVMLCFCGGWEKRKFEWVFPGHYTIHDSAV
jgi:hypothetical protein